MVWNHFAFEFRKEFLNSVPISPSHDGWLRDKGEHILKNILETTKN